MKLLDQGSKQYLTTVNCIYSEHICYPLGPVWLILYWTILLGIRCALTLNQGIMQFNVTISQNIFEIYLYNILYIYEIHNIFPFGSSFLKLNQGMHLRRINELDLRFDANWKILSQRLRSKQNSMKFFFFYCSLFTRSPLRWSLSQ